MCKYGHASTCSKKQNPMSYYKTFPPQKLTFQQRISQPSNGYYVLVCYLFSLDTSAAFPVYTKIIAWLITNVFITHVQVFSYVFFFWVFLKVHHSSFSLCALISTFACQVNENVYLFMSTLFILKINMLTPQIYLFFYTITE